MLKRRTIYDFFSKIRTQTVASNQSRSDVEVLAPAAPTAIPIYKIIMAYPSLFPRSIKASINDYYCFESNIDKIQTDLLSTLPFYPDSSGNKIATLLKTPIDDDGTYINEFIIKPKYPTVAKDKMKHLIFIHGYGAALGFFIKSFENIDLMNGQWCIHAIDLPGFGFSSRNEFPFSYDRDSLDDVQNWFHSKLLTWFENRGLLVNPENNVVMAHSLGAYLMASYVKKNPTHFKKLIMCSPAGIRPPKNAKAINPPWWFNILWEKNFSPFSLVRNSYVLGSKLTSGWSYRRFKKLSNHTQTDLFEKMHRYAYSIFNQKGSGEYILSFALKCGGFPRYPLENHLFGHDTIGDITKSPCEWIWMYGENDWMNIEGGERVSEILRLHGKRSVVHSIPNSGHHLYFDNYKLFNEILMNEMRTMSQKNK